MLSEFYQKVLRVHLNESQYLLLKILVLLLQSQRQVRLSVLARVFPQPIQYPSRICCLQRFLAIPQLSLPLLWHPIIKCWLRRKFKASHQNKNARYLWQSSKSKYLLVSIDRTQWRDKNLFVASLIWKRHAIPLHWQLLPKVGSSSLSEQKKLLIPVLKLLKSMSIVIIGDREFHSAKLGQWLQGNKVDFILRQKANAYVQILNSEYQPLNRQGFEVSDKLFYHGIHCNKTEDLGDFNLAVYCQRGRKKKKAYDPWYLLTSILPQ